MRALVLGAGVLLIVIRERLGRVTVGPEAVIVEAADVEVPNAEAAAIEAAVIGPIGLGSTGGNTGTPSDDMGTDDVIDLESDAVSPSELAKDDPGLCSDETGGGFSKGTDA